MARRVKKQNRSKKKLIIIVVVVVVGVLALLKTYAANSASFYLAPASGSYQKGADVAVTVRLNTGIGVSSSQVQLTYPADKIEYISSASVGADLESNSVIKQSEGSLQITNSTATFLGKSGDLKLTTLNFKAKADGNTVLSVKSPSIYGLVGLVVGLVDASTINTIGANYTIALPNVVVTTPAQAPTQSAPTTTSQPWSGSPSSSTPNQPTTKKTGNTAPPVSADLAPAIEGNPDLTLTTTNGDQLPYATFRQSGFSNSAGLIKHNKLTLGLAGLGGLVVYGLIFGFALKRR